MARQVDESKMDRIKEAALQLVVENGYGGASISMIAKKAGVAEGYLYRFYSSKYELISSLLYSKINIIIERIEDLLSQTTGIAEIVQNLYDMFYAIENESPDHLKFMHVLLHDYNFQVSDEQRAKIKTLCEQLRSKGMKTAEIRASVTNEDIFMMVVIYPIEMINLRMKNFLGSDKITSAGETAKFSLNALK
jgi:AcrR family transcriptional regulator